MIVNSNIKAKNVRTLRDSVLRKIKKSPELRIAIMAQRDVKETTLLKWLRDNSTELTKYSTLDVIAQYLETDIVSLLNPS